MRNLMTMLLAAACTISVKAGDPEKLLKTVAEVQYPERVFVNTNGNICVDFGKDAFGWLEISAPKAGLNYFLGLGELLFPNGVLCRTPGRTVRAEGVAWHTEKPGFQRIPVAPDLRNSFSAKEGDPAGVRPEFGLVMPFRAVEIYRADFPITKDTIRRHVVSYPADRKESSFSCDDPRLVKVYDFCKYTMFATSFAGKFVDGDRERIPYEADAYASQMNWYAVSSDYAYPRKSIEYLYTHPTWPTEFRQISVLSAWTDWMWTGDTRSLEKYYDLLKDKKLLTRFEREDGLVLSGGEKCKPQHCNRFGLADIVDWPEVERDGFDFRDVNAVVNAFHYRSLLAMADIASALGKAGDAAEFRARADRLKRIFIRTFFNEKTGLFIDGEDSAHSSLHVNALAVAFDLVDGERAGKIADWLTMRGMACSVYFSQYLMEALFKTGRADAAVGLMTASDDRSWIGMLNWGATMTMEAWNMRVKPNMDWNHSWGATPLNAISRFLCGVTPLKPGFAEISIAPAAGPLAKVDAVVPVQNGAVKVKIDGDILTVDTPAPSVVHWRGRTVRTAGGRVTIAPERTVRASSFGFDPKDATAALQQAFDSGAEKIVVDRQKSDWICRPLFITNSNVEIVFEDGVTVRARKGEFHGTNDRLLTVRGVTNVILRSEGSASLVMNKSDYLDPKQKYRRALGGHRHALGIYSARGVAVRRLNFRSSGGDGIYVNKVRNLLLDRVNSEDNLRQGISVISVSGLEARNCSFSTTAGAPPQSGLDVEPNSAKETVENMLFDGCLFNGNASNGVEFHLVHLKKESSPLTAAFRNCRMTGNGRCGVKTCASRDDSGVGGRVMFENCVFSGNGKRPALFTNHLPGALEFGFRRCLFDSAGGSENKAVMFDNGQTQLDFAGVEFVDCTVAVQGKKELFGFSGMSGSGVVGMTGTVEEDRDGYRRPYRLERFTSRHRPCPEKKQAFRMSTADLRALRPIAEGDGRNKAEAALPDLRKRFTVIKHVAAAGKCRVEFALKELRRNPMPAKVTVTDFTGRTFAVCNLTRPSDVVEFDAEKPGIYLLEVDSGGYLMSVRGRDRGLGVMVKDRINAFRQSDARFYFAVPAGARTVMAEIMPEEPASARLLDASGNVVAESDFKRTASVLKAERSPSRKAEVWSLHFPKVQEDYKFRIGGDAVPVVSASPDSAFAL